MSLLLLLLLHTRTAVSFVSIPSITTTATFNPAAAAAATAAAPVKQQQQQQKYGRIIATVAESQPGCRSAASVMRRMGRINDGRKATAVWMVGDGGDIDDNRSVEEEWPFHKSRYEW